MDDPKHYGLEMMWALQKRNVDSKADVVILLVHWFLTKKGFRNVGVGDDKTLDNSVEQSELLPEGWNGNKTSYALRYTLNNELYILHGTVSEETLIVNLLQAKTVQVSNAAFNLNTAVQSINSADVRLLFADIGAQITRLDRELVKPLHDGGTKNSGSQTSARSAGSNAAPIRNPSYGEERSRLQIGRGQLPQVGQADLNPFGGLGGGMLMDPLRGMGPGVRLPGARIDPIGPFNRNNRPFPDPDHLPPPGYDDMFM
uniref:Proteasome inhibitor PI31 subunit n=1 Tax=Anopheles farauti TaxID=69004 RepID=A0A182Q9T2_9DIPT